MPLSPMLFLANHHNGSIFLIIIKVCPFLKGRSSSSQKENRLKTNMILMSLLFRQIYILFVHEVLNTKRKLFRKNKRLIKSIYIQFEQVVMYQVIVVYKKLKDRSYLKMIYHQFYILIQNFLDRHLLYNDSLLSPL